MCLEHPCYERLNRFAFSKPARIMYCVVLALICILICIQLLQASNKLKEQKERDASRIEVIPMTNDGYLIYTNQSNFEGWSRNIDNALEAYKVHNPNRQTCQDSSTVASEKPCDVDLNQFGPCTLENHFGYSTNSPCVFLKLKKVKDWVPKVLNSSTLPTKMPEDLKKYIQHDRNKVPMVYLSCIGDNPADVENMGPLEYYPQHGYPTNFFPFTNQDGYLEPLVAVHFAKPHLGIVFVVECTLWAENLQDALKFELLVD